MKVAIDIGGTFTDIITVDDAGAIAATKVPTRPQDLSKCFLSAVEGAIDSAGSASRAPEELLYSTTLALNSLLTHALPSIGLIVNRGFREILETARLPLAEHDGNEMRQPLAKRLVSLELVKEIGARLNADGSVRKAVDEQEVAALAEWYGDRSISIVAVSLLHCYLDPTQERQVAAVFARVAPRIEVVLSTEVLPELREYERTLAACLNACLMPAMKDHIECVMNESGLARSALLVMKSSGGLASARSAMKKPLTTALSGPSAAVVGMVWLGARTGYEELITLDIGGTSTDVALVKHGQCALTTYGEIAGFPFKTPMIDVLTIGAGGGSIASQGSDERWRVGPGSAGADPGPVCYGRSGDQVTLTDAQILLGRLPRALLGGTLPLNRDAAAAALTSFGRTRGLDAVRCARGILEIATHNMCGAIRRISVQRGHDPKDYVLFAMGGAGPLHAADLATLLGMRSIVVPPQPGLAAALGLLVADVKDDFVQAFGQNEDALDVDRAQAFFDTLEEAALRFLDDEHVPENRRRVQRHIDMRYAGMSNETTVELAPGPVTEALLQQAIDAFHDQFHRLSGHSYAGRETVELVNLRTTAIGERAGPGVLNRLPKADRKPLPRAQREVAYLGHPTFIDSAVYVRDSLGAGSTIRGPAVVEQYDSTIIIPPDFAAEIDEFGNMMLRPS